MLKEVNEKEVPAEDILGDKVLKYSKEERFFKTVSFFCLCLWRSGTDIFFLLRPYFSLETVSWICQRAFRTLFRSEKFMKT